MLSKIHPRERLVKIIAKLKSEGKKIGVTNGAFDLLHAGHVQYLEDAKKLCDILVVSVNTDESVRLYKDPRRPINSEKDRALVVAGLSSVDYVTFHNERRMRETLLALKPDLYIKGGDYNPDSLTSKDVLDAWGGKIAFVPLLPNRSTTKTIEKIVDEFGKTQEIPLKNKPSKTKVVFLDRDGVINEEKEYVSEQKDFVFLPKVFEGLKALQKMGYQVVIVTNQAGIGLGYFTKEDFYRVNKYMLLEFSKQGILISKIYFCPHSLTDKCDCRKPKTGMFENAKKDLNIDMKHSWMIGDKQLDIEAGKKAGCKTILIGSSTDFTTMPDFVAPNLVESAKIIKSNP